MNPTLCNFDNYLVTNNTGRTYYMYYIDYSSEMCLFFIMYAKRIQLL